MTTQPFNPALARKIFAAGVADGDRLYSRMSEWAVQYHKFYKAGYDTTAPAARERQRVAELRTLQMLRAIEKEYNVSLAAYRERRERAAEASANR